MVEFYRISFEADELEALKGACAMQSAEEDLRLDEAAAGDLDGAVMQESRADDMLLMKSTVSIFKPGQAILITKEDLGLMQKSLERFKDEAPPELLEPIESAIEKIENPGTSV
jgi:hypothetical protein